MTQAKAGKVYFVAAPGRIKIGFTISPESRLDKLRQVDMEELTMLGIVDGTRRLERHLHRKLAPFRLKGEWFLDCPDVRSAIAGCSNFSESEETMRKPGSSLDEGQFVEEARTHCDELLRRERRDGVSAARATSMVALKTGISHGRIWQLQYRPPKSVTAAELFALRKQRTEEITGSDSNAVRAAKALLVKS